LRDAFQGRIGSAVDLGGRRREPGGKLLENWGR
jgi:hypothetical protein